MSSLHALIHCAMQLLAQLCPTLCDPEDCSPPGSSVHGDSPSKHMGVGCHALLQGIIPTQGMNPGLPHSRWILYPLSHQGSPEWPVGGLNQVKESTPHIRPWQLQQNSTICLTYLKMLNNQTLISVVYFWGFGLRNNQCQEQRRVCV